MLFSSMLLKIESIMSAGCPQAEVIIGKTILDTQHPPVNRGYCGKSSFWEFCGHTRKDATKVPLTRVWYVSISQHWW